MVLLVDADPQGSLTVSLGVKDPDDLDVSLSSLKECAQLLLHIILERSDLIVQEAHGQ